MGKCESCGGCSGGCSGCGLELELTEEEISFLHRLGECAFLPVIQERKRRFSRRKREKSFCCKFWRKRA